MVHPAFPSRFQIELELPRAASGRLFRAVDGMTGRPSKLVAVTAQADAVLALRRDHLERERLAGPHMVEAIAIGPLEDDAGWYRAEAWIEPVPSAVSPLELSVWLPGWLSALAAMHAAGRVHADLHPGSLGFGLDGVARLASPGLAWHVGQPAGLPEVGAARWRYLAPEAWGQGRVDARTDLFMLGATLLHWLSDGKVATPRTAEELAAVLDNLSGPALPWADLLGGLLAPAPADRFASAGEALAAVPGAPGSALPGPAGRVAPFVGRRQELRALAEGLDEAIGTSHARFMVVGGEAGVGKSRLLEELRQRARARGFDVVHASAARGANMPYGGVMALLEALVARVPAAVKREVAPALTSLLPSLGKAAPGLEPRAERSRLMAAIADLVEAAARPNGLLVCLDDWQSADAASRDVLDFLSRTTANLPLYVVVSGREAPPEGGLSLGGLGRKEAAALCRGLWDGREPGGGVVTSLEEHCGGNPGMLEQAAIACRTAMAADGRKGAAAVLASATLPATLGAMWRTRMFALPQPARTLALAAAVAGARAGLALLQGVAELDEEDFLEALETLGEAGVLAADTAGYTLQAPAEQVLMLAENREELREMHARALGHHRLAGQLGQAVVPARLAYHALEADRAQEGAFYALAAAREALRLFALEEAASLLTRGAAAMGRCPDAPGTWQVDYLVARGDLERYLARGFEAERCYREALARLADDPIRRTEVLTSLGIALNLTARGDEAEPLYHEAIALASDPVLRARAVTALARMHVRLGRSDAAIRACQDVLGLSGAGLTQRGEALGLLGLLCVNAGDAPAGLEHLAKAQSLARSTGDRLSHANACMLAGNARFGLGQLEPARDEFSRYALLCQELGLPDEALCASLNLAQVAYEQGRFAEAWQRSRAGSTVAAESGNRVYEAFGLAHVALSGVQLGYLADAEAAALKAVEVADELGEALALQVGVARLEMKIFLGGFGGAEELGLVLQRRARAAGLVEVEGAIALALGQIYTLSGETAAAVEQLRQARSAAVASGNQLLQSRVALSFGQVALASGQIAVAQARGLDALALAEASGASLVQLRAHLLVAQTSWQLGLPESTGANLDCAQELAQGLGSPHWQAIAWLAQSRLSPDGAALRLKAATFIQFYMQQLPPRARQEFLNWPERRDALTGRGTTALELRIPAAPPPGASQTVAREDRA